MLSRSTAIRSSNSEGERLLGIGTAPISLRPRRGTVAPALTASYGKTPGHPARIPSSGGFPAPDETILETILLTNETILGSRRNHPETVAGPFSPLRIRRKGDRGASNEPFHLQCRPFDPFKDRDYRPRGRHRGGGFRYLGADRFRRRHHPDRPRHEGRQAGRHHQFRRFGRSLRERAMWTETDQLSNAGMDPA